MNKLKDIINKNNNEWMTEKNNEKKDKEIKQKKS